MHNSTHKHIHQQRTEALLTWGASAEGLSGPCSTTKLWWAEAISAKAGLNIKQELKKKKNWSEARVATHFGGITTQGCYNVPPEHHVWQTLGDSGRNRTTWSTHTGEKPSAEATLREPGTKMNEDCKAAIINMLRGLRSSLKGLNGSIVRVTHQLRKISKETEMLQEHPTPVLGWSHPTTKWKTHSAEHIDCQDTDSANLKRDQEKILSVTSKGEEKWREMACETVQYYQINTG